MTLRLTVDHARWRAHVAATADRVTASGDLVAVVKGNGYGIGRDLLIAEARRHTRAIAVGTVHEAAALARAAAPTSDLEVQVLTPPTEPVAGLGLGDHVVLTVGSLHHAAAVAGHVGPVAVKLRSSMRRYGVTPSDLPAVVAALARQGRDVHHFVLHLPLLGPARDAAAQVAEIDAWTAHLADDATVSVSHLEADDFAHLAASRPGRRWRLRTGTALWHGDKTFLHLQATVVDTSPVRAAEVAGYRATPLDAEGTLVMVGAGSAHGVTPLADGRSPFHHDRRRLPLLEPPHMHTSMCIAPADGRVPTIGEWVDVQRPLTAVLPDEIVLS